MCFILIISLFNLYLSQIYEALSEFFENTEKAENVKKLFPGL